jgi:rhodanese-related sulfurtransferase
MRIRIALVCSSLALLTLNPAAIATQGADAIDAPRISMPAFKKLFAAKNVVIVDTRNAEEFARSHIPGAILLPLEGQLTWPESYEPTVRMLQKTKKPVVAYCA